MSKDQALWEIQRVIELDRDGKTTEAATAAQRFLDKNGKHPTAIHAAAIWAKSDTQNARALYALGRAYLFQGKFNEASSGFELAIKIDPNMGEAWSGLALCLNTNGDLIRSLECAEKAASINPRDINAQLCILDTLYDMGEFHKGLERGHEIEKTLKNVPGIFLNIGRLYRELDNFEKAEIYYKKAIKFDPDNPIHHLSYLLLKDARGEKDAVKHDLPVVLKLFNKSPSRKLLMANAYTKLGFINAAYEGKPIEKYTERAHFLTNCDMDDETSLTPNFRLIDKGDPLQLFEAKDIKAFTTDTIYYDDTKCWQNHRYTGTAYTFLLGSGGGRSYILEPNDPIPLNQYGIFLSSSENYYHWLFDHLPRLAIINQHPELAKLPIYMCDDDNAATQLAGMVALGISPDQIIRLPKKQAVHIKHAVIPYLPGRPMNKKTLTPVEMEPVYNHFNYRWLRETYVKNPPKPTRRLFLTREGTKFRRLINEAAIFAIAQKYGFEKINNAGTTFQQQVDLYASAEALCGPHGASFTNMAFMENNTTTSFELFPKNRRPPYYERIATEKNMRYLHLDGPIVRKFKNANADFGDFHIDEQEFARIMAENFG